MCAFITRGQCGTNKVHIEIEANTFCADFDRAASSAISVYTLDGWMNMWQCGFVMFVECHGFWPSCCELGELIGAAIDKSYDENNGFLESDF